MQLATKTTTATQSNKEKFLCQYSKAVQQGKYVRGYLEDLEINFNVILNKIVKKERVSFCVHSDTFNRDQINKNISKLLEVFEKSFVTFGMDTALKPTEEVFERDLKKEFYLLPNYVNYVIQSFEIPHFSHPDIPKLNVMGEFIS